MVLNESTDVTHTPPLVFLQGVSMKFEVTEELP